MTIPTGNSTIRIRDLRASVISWLASRVVLEDGTGPQISGPGGWLDSMATDLLVAWQGYRLTPLGAPRGTVKLVTGELRLDLYATKQTAPTPSAAETDRLERLHDALISVLDEARIPVFGITARMAEPTPAVKVLKSTATLTPGSTAITLASSPGTAGWPGAGTVLLGGESITYASSGGTSLGTLTRAVQQTTTPAIHLAGGAVLLDPGVATGSLSVEALDFTHLGFDVAAQRIRGLLRVGFALGYALPTS